MIACWPKVITSGRITEERAIGMDFYPTFLEMAGVSAPNGLKFDGISLLPVFKGMDLLPKRPLFFHFPHYTGSVSPYSSVIDGGWKLIRFYNDERGGYLLFNLSKDEAEQQDLSGVYPERVRSMAKQLREELESMGAEFPTPNSNFNARAKRLSHRASNYHNANAHRATFKGMLERVMK